MKFSVPVHKAGKAVVYLLPAALSLSIFGCGKTRNDSRNDDNIAKPVYLANYAGPGKPRELSQAAIGQLQDARAATARYNNFQTAVRDGYIDINVIIPQTGFHYLQVDRLDSGFDPARPEILIYNREANGRMKLVALEYAIPVALSPAAPEGFAGNDDVWSVYQNTLWTLYAWVWEHNPSGVFSPVNPEVHIP